MGPIRPLPCDCHSLPVQRDDLSDLGESSWVESLRICLQNCAKLLSFEKAWQLEVWGTEDSQTWGTKGTSFDVIVAVRGKWAATIKEVYP